MKKMWMAAVLTLAALGAHAAEPVGLTAEQIDGLRAGRGMNLSLPAERNRKPGPLHVVELAGPLALTPAQLQAVEELVTAMRGEAQALGHAIIAAEAALDSLFRADTVDGAAVAAQVAEIARLNGELRLVHLKAHMATTALLSPDQVDAYVRARTHHHHRG